MLYGAELAGRGIIASIRANRKIGRMRKFDRK